MLSRCLDAYMSPGEGTAWIYLYPDEAWGPTTLSIGIGK